MTSSKKPKLLAGGNPQIPKGDGDAPVRAYLRGTSLDPVPPGGSAKEARWLDVHEGDLDEAQMERWIRQAAALPGWDGTSRG
ncbi:MAG: hypothetical protein R3B81_09815 [bacterium]